VLPCAETLVNSLQVVQPKCGCLGYTFGMLEH
jgi:hypothetical protein